MRFAAEQTEAAVGGTLWEISDTSLENFETYETVIIAFEADSGQLPGTVRNFLNTYDFGAKSVIPLIINGGDQLSKLTDDISRLQPGALIRDNGFAVAGDNIGDHAQEMTQWAQSLGLDQENTDAENETIQTAAHGQVDAGTRQTFYLWEEGAIDLARALRFVRSHADEYGIDEADIAVMGFSAGGILNG